MKDETYVKIKGSWFYLYRGVDKHGNVLEFLLTKNRDKKAAKRFFKKMLGNKYVPNPRVINVDKNKAYPPAVDALKKEKMISKRCFPISATASPITASTISPYAGAKAIRTIPRAIY